MTCLRFLLLFIQVSKLVESAVSPVTLVPASTSLVFRRDNQPSFLLSNGKAAQKLNAKFLDIKADTPCKAGETACINSGFSQCVAGKYVGTPCAGGLKCFAMPLLLKEGTSLGCNTESDTAARIANTGATGGLTGTGSRVDSDINSSSIASEKPQERPSSTSGSDMGMNTTDTPSANGNNPNADNGGTSVNENESSPSQSDNVSTTKDKKNKKTKQIDAENQGQSDSSNKKSVEEEIGLDEDSKRGSGERSKKDESEERVKVNTVITDGGKRPTRELSKDGVEKKSDVTVSKEVEVPKSDCDAKN